ncbi:sulfatase [Kiritimatiella glycovorans]|uniref:Arylsulfatase n=1 Tax=Kiritimatiella glycovorans TaxID=1307763 RepID=A0A0G3EE45_9BACT|nr:sulfatase-like hydrolase/transferase [Kiritimatiella glycovorans]AKJ64588.1 Arylsulfatase [Kiritimatiella glycovorans]
MAGKMSRRPNIVFVHVDQLKQSAIGACGCERVRTPGMDRIMNDAVSFDRYYATVPVCVPSRTSWYTGLEPDQSGITENPRWIDREEVHPTDLGTWLRDRGGYDSYYMGKWHIAIKPQECGFEQLHGSNPVGEYGDTALARAAEDFLLNHRGERPFFLSVGLLNPHDICYWSFRYSPGKFGIADRIRDRLPPLPPNFDPERAATDWTELEWRFYAHAYFRFVEMIDGDLGRIYRAFQRSPERDRTIFIFSSDHGQASGEHGHLTKGTPYEHSLRIPLAVVDPSAAPRRDRTHLVSGLDMAPTICDYAGVERMPRNHDMSFRPLVEGGAGDWREWLVASTPRMKHRVIYRGDFKLIHERRGETDRLFNLKDDPWEMRDLADDPAHASVLRELRALREEYDESREVCRMAQEDFERWE